MITNTIKPYQPTLTFLQKKSSKPQSSSVRFGRDAIFERNDRFDKTPLPVWNPDVSEDVLYTVQGRVRNKALLPLALEYARREYNRVPKQQTKMRP